MTHLFPHLIRCHAGELLGALPFFIAALFLIPVFLRLRSKY